MNIRPFKELGLRVQLLCAAAFCFALLATSFFFLFSAPACAGDNCTEQHLILANGTSFRSAAKALESAGVVRSSTGFEIYALLKGQRDAIKSGEYAFDGESGLSAVLAKLVAGDVKRYSITLVEGKTINQFLETLHKAEALDPILRDSSDAQLLDAVNSFAPSVVEQYGAEGLFAPETFIYTRGESDFQILLRAHQLLTDTLEEYWSRRKIALPLNTPYDALILASIIERESALEAERERIAGVFVNRLNAGMRLQSDPTTIYGLGDEFDGRLTREQLNTVTPYNTYKIDGLPPTPISSASNASLRAALNPELHEFYYFVADGKGGHVFSKTLEEHNVAVANYRRRENTANPN